MRLKLVSLLLILCMAAAMPQIAEATAVKPIQLIVNGKKIEGAKSIVRSGYMYAPYRILFEAVGFKTGYDAATGEIWGTLGESKLSFSAGSDVLEYDGRLYYGQIPVINGQTYLPVRLVGEIAGYAVHYDKNASTLTMKAYGFGQEAAIQNLIKMNFGPYNPKYLTKDNAEHAYHNPNYDYVTHERVSEVPVRLFKAEIAKRKYMSANEAVMWVTYTQNTDVLELKSKCTIHMRKEDGQWKIVRTNWYSHQSDLVANADELAAAIVTNQKVAQKNVLEDLHAYYNALNAENYERQVEYTSPNAIRAWNEEVGATMTWEEVHEGLFEEYEMRYKLSGERVLFLGEKEAVVHAILDWSDSTQGVAEEDDVHEVLITLDYANGHWTYYEDFSLDNDYDDSGLFASQ